MLISNLTLQFNMFYKWRHIIVPNTEKSLIKFISAQTFTNRNECVEAARGHGHAIPDSYGGPYLQLLYSRDHHSLENVYNKNKRGEIAIIDANVFIEDIDPMPYALTP